MSVPFGGTATRPSLGCSEILLAVAAGRFSPRLAKCLE